MRIEAQRFIILVTAGLRRSVYSVGASDVVLRLVRPLESYP